MTNHLGAYSTERAPKPIQTSASQTQTSVLNQFEQSLALSLARRSVPKLSRRITCAGKQRARRWRWHAHRARRVRPSAAPNRTRRTQNCAKADPGLVRSDARCSCAHRVSDAQSACGVWEPTEGASIPSWHQSYDGNSQVPAHHDSAHPKIAVCSACQGSYADFPSQPEVRRVLLTVDFADVAVNMNALWMKN